MVNNQNLDYDGTDYQYFHNTSNTDGYYDDYFTDHSSKDFLQDLAREEKKHCLIRFLNVFLYGGMLIVDWIERKLKKREK